MRKLLITTFILFTFTSLGFAGNSQYKTEAGFLWWRVPKIQEKLELSENQINKIEEIFQSYRDDLVKYKSNINKNQNKLETMLIDPGSPRTDIKSQSSKVHKLKLDAKSVKFDMNLDIREVLTSEQRQKLSEMRREYRKNKYKKYEDQKN